MFATDGYYGELDDIVVDSTGRRITHVVVVPAGRQNQTQKRLVPMWLLDDQRSEFTVMLQTDYVAQLQRVFAGEYVRIPRLTAQYDEFEIAFRTVLFPPYYEDDRDLTNITPANLTNGGLRPRDNSIRRGSECVGADDKHLGVVEGFLTSQGQVTAVIIRVRNSIGRRDVAVPLHMVAAIYSDMIVLSAAKTALGQFPTTTAVNRQPGTTLDRIHSSLLHARRNAHR